GNFSVVKLSIEKSTGNRYACKIIRKRKFSLQPKVLQSFTREVRFKSVSPPNIIFYHEVYENDQYLCILTEFVQGGDLLSYVTDRGHLTEDEGRCIFYQLASAIEYLHNKGITHRDLKPENIMMAEDNSLVKLTDFGLAKHLNENTFVATMCGTPNYLAPEIIAPLDGSPKYNKLVDMWSLGVILYHMLTGQLPFEGQNQQELYRQITSGIYNGSDPQYRRLSPEARGLIAEMLKVQPRERLPIDQALIQPWLYIGPARSSWGSLRVLSDGELIRKDPLRQAIITIGRGLNTQLQLANACISKLHCVVLYNGRTVLLKNSSRNDIEVNGVTLDTMRLVILKDGDVIELFPDRKSGQGRCQTQHYIYITYAKGPHA
ncbi:kinase-like domain-containing protein, partial [Dimargaris cristalligena]